MEREGKREHLVDALRGTAVLSMVLFHFCYDVFMILGRDPGWYERRPVSLWQQSICWSFILISGYVWRWGKRHALRRGLLLNACGALVSLVTWLAVPEEAVWFGVLTFLGCAVLLLAAMDTLLDRQAPAVGLAVSALLFLLLRHVAEGWIGLGALQLRLPEALYTCKVLTPLGFPGPAFRSGDYFPLLPWFCLYLCGYFLQPLLLRSARWRKLATRRCAPLGWIGRRSLWIYMLHQPLCMGLAWLLFR
ncbi:MAG: heparan-alpha-glucosaminide N-acetyltransferase [Eubacteriales bacterium]|nr:heparan-alpha-glucosaminide N-acetyltransferase [Eubacteriales bacterium]